MCTLQGWRRSERSQNFDFNLDPIICLPVEKTGPTKDAISILVDANDVSKFLKIRSRLSPKLWKMLIEFLLENLDVFVLSHSDMVRIDPEVMCHYLNIIITEKA